MEKMLSCSTTCTELVSSWSRQVSRRGAARRVSPAARWWLTGGLRGTPGVERRGGTFGTFTRCGGGFVEICRTWPF